VPDDPRPVDPVTRLEPQGPAGDQVRAVVLTVQAERLPEASRSAGERAVRGPLAPALPREVGALDHPPGPEEYG
jgi:hypothetical protein